VTAALNRFTAWATSSSLCAEKRGQPADDAGLLRATIYTKFMEPHPANWVACRPKIAADTAEPGSYWRRFKGGDMATLLVYGML
jgi:hypothetical protein